MTFFVGQQVVCIDDSWRGLGVKKDGHWVSKDETYTITSIHIDRMGMKVFWLAEVERSPGSFEKWGAECGFAAYRFRPKTDISIFTGMLSESPVDHEEYA